MHIGITESQTHKILLDEMGKTGLIDGDGLVLFGGESPGSLVDHAEIMLNQDRERRPTPRRRFASEAQEGGHDPD